MESKITDINDLVEFLASTGMKPLLCNETWKCYGYTKRPKHGNIWDRIFPKIFELENYISKEILTMGLIDVLNGIKKSAETPENKLLLSIGVVDLFLSTTNHMIPSGLFMENLFSSYDAFLKSDKSKLHEPVLLKAKNVLCKKDFARFMTGTIVLFSMVQADDFLLKSDYIKEVIESSSIENKLKISLPEEIWKKYGALLSEKILNT